MEVEDWDYMREKFEDSDMDLDKKHREIFQDTLEQMDGEFQNLLSNSKNDLSCSESQQIEAYF